MKLSFLAPVAALTVGVVVIAPRGHAGASPPWPGRCRVLCAGGYWYVRNAIATGGNPIPFVSSLGPIELPGPRAGVRAAPRASPSSHYWNDTAGLAGLVRPRPRRVVRPLGR